MAVAAHRVQIEEVDGAHLSQAQFQAPDRNCGSQGQRVTGSLGGLLAEGNGVVQHHARDVRRFSKSGIAHYIHVWETADAQRVAEAGSSRAFDIAKDLQPLRNLEAGVERLHARGRMFFVG